MKQWKICTYPQIISSSLYGNEKKQLIVATCFNTNDSWEQVAAWYEPLGWTGENLPTDTYGMGLTGKINFGRVAQITSRRQVLFSLYEPVDVKVVSTYEIHSDTFSSEP